LEFTEKWLHYPGTGGEKVHIFTISSSDFFEPKAAKYNKMVDPT